MIEIDKIQSEHDDITTAARDGAKRVLRSMPTEPTPRACTDGDGGISFHWLDGANSRMVIVLADGSVDRYEIRDGKLVR